jgi:peroxiredoxin
MSALEAGVVAPDFTLPTVDGKQISLAGALTKGPAVLAFFKISCPVCQYAFPFFERLYSLNRADNVSVLGVSQDNVKDTKSFMREYGVAFPVAIDNSSKGYPVSSAYGLTNVPTLFLISPDGQIEASSVSWSKADVESVNQKLAEYRHQKPVALWRSGEDIREFRPG